MKLTGPKGTARKAAERKAKNPRMNLKLASLLLAAAVGIGAITIGGRTVEKDETTISEMQQEGFDMQRLGLSQETIEKLKKYDQYFEEFDAKEYSDITDNYVINMLAEMEELHFSVVKERMAHLTGQEKDKIKMYYKFEKGDGETYTSVVVEKDDYGRKDVYTSHSTALPFNIGAKNSIPKEISKVIEQLEDLSKIEEDLKADHITKINAIKRIEKLYRNVEKVATSQLIMDEKGNICIMEFDDGQIKTSELEEKER